MSTSAENNENDESDGQLDAVAVLREVMPYVCEYLNRKDLRNLAEVCKSWRDEAWLEKKRRRYIQQLRLFYKFGNLDSALQVEPYVSLLIYDTKLEKALPQDKLPRLRKKVLKHFEKKQPHRAIVLKVKECLTSEDVDCVVTKDQGELKVTRNIHCGILGLFLPNVNRRLRVRVAWKPGIRTVDYGAFMADCFADKLGLDDETQFKFKSTLLVFIEPNEPGAATVAHQLHARINKDKETLWVAEVGGELIAANFHNSRRHRKNKKKCIAVVKISGPTVESWSQRFDLRLPREEVDRQLRELRKQVKLKKHCTALLAAPCKSEYGSSQQIMSDIKRIFPGIPFVGLFDSHKKSILNSEDENMPFLVEDYAWLSLVIMTYN